jgi:hypothetical protein
MITLKANGMTLVQPVLSVNGYLTASDPRPHFGLGRAVQAESIEIAWPDGDKQVLENVPANQILVVRSKPAK